VADAEPTNARRHLRLVRGDATPEEVAAIVAVLAARGAASGSEAAPPPRSAWSEPRHSLRAELVGGPDAWRRSGFTPGIRTRADW
jgi:hypothetical protein